MVDGIAIRLVSLATGHRSPFDGQYVKDYDPRLIGRDPEGRPLNCYLVTTPDLEKAKVFPTFLEAHDYWMWSFGIRSDGRSNRPLTAFCVEFPRVGRGELKPKKVKKHETLGGHDSTEMGLPDQSPTQGTPD